MALKTSQLVALTTTQIAQGLTTDQVTVLTTAEVAALTTAEVAALNTADVSSLSTVQVVKGLSTSQIAALTTTQVAQGLNTSQIAALSTTQVIVMNTEAVAALTADQAVALTTAQIVALTTAQIVALNTSDITALSTSQVSAFTTTQVMVLTSDQTLALGSNTSYLKMGSPLVLDLSGNGITTQSILAGTKFDVFGTGQAVNTGWVSGSSEGFLVYDPNNGPITSGSQLFGTATVLPNGQKAANGFAALGAIDTNGDGVITSADAGWTNLKIWVDGNSDGVTQTGELHTLDSLGITQLNLSDTTSSTKNNGNLLGLIGSYATSDGKIRQMTDVWFVADPSQNAIVPSPSTSIFAATQSPSTSQITALSTVQIAALAPPPANALTTARNLQTQVGGLVQAMGTFNGSQSAVSSSIGNSAINPPPSVALASSVAIVSTNMDGIVRVLKQFDPNGNPLVASQIINSVSISTPTLTTVSNSTNTGILVMGK